MLTRGVALVAGGRLDDVDETRERVFDVATEDIEVGDLRLRGDVGRVLRGGVTCSLEVDALRALHELDLAEGETRLLVLRVLRQCLLERGDGAVVVALVDRLVRELVQRRQLGLGLLAALSAGLARCVRVVVRHAARKTVLHSDLDDLVDELARLRVFDDRRNRDRLALDEGRRENLPRLALLRGLLRKLSEDLTDLGRGVEVGDAHEDAPFLRAHRARERSDGRQGRRLRTRPDRDDDGVLHRLLHEALEVLGCHVDDKTVVTERLGDDGVVGALRHGGLPGIRSARRVCRRRSAGAAGRCASGRCGAPGRSAALRLLERGQVNGTAQRRGVQRLIRHALIVAGRAGAGDA